MKDFSYQEASDSERELALEELLAIEKSALITQNDPTEKFLELSTNDSNGDKILRLKPGENPFQELSDNEFMYLGVKRTMLRDGDHLYMSPFTEEEAEPFSMDSIKENGWPDVIHNGRETWIAFVMIDIMNPEPQGTFTAHYIDAEGVEVLNVTHVYNPPSSSTNKEETGSTSEEKQSESKTDTAPKVEEGEEDERRIVYEKSVENEHTHNNTGYIFKRANGEPITDASEVRKFIKAQKKSDDPEISKQFKEDFPVAREGTTAGFNAPTLEIEGYAPKYYSMLGNPRWGMEDEEPVKKEPTEDTDFIGSYVNNKSAKVNVPNGIILHDTPDTDDPLYEQIKRSDFKDDFLLKKGSKLEIIAKSNKDNPGWVMVRDENNMVGWIEERYVTETEPTDVLSQFTGKMYLVKKGDGLSEVLLNEISAKDLAGEDIRDYALAFFLLNKDDVNFTSYMTSYYEEDKNNYFDPDKADARRNFKSIKLIEGTTVRIPTRAFLEKAKADGLIKTRSEEQQMFIDFANYGEAFLEGIYDGFVTSAQDFAEGIWELIESIFSGEILEQFKQMWAAIKELIKDPSQIIALFKDLVADFETKWNNPNQLEAWHFRGEVLGQIIFEVVMALVGIGAAKLLGELKKLGKLGDMITSMEKKISKVKSKVTPKLPKKRPDTNKKGDLAFSPVKDKDKTLKETFDKKKADFEEQFEKDLLDKTSDLIKDRAEALKRYKARGGKMSQSKWELKYNTLAKNRKIGKIGEDTFESFMNGYKPDFGIDAGQGTRYIDNIKPNTKTAREIKTGRVKLTKSIKKQIDNDFDILVNELSSKVRKVEWHFLDGADDKVKKYIEKKIKDNNLGSDAIKYIEY
jgi:hypothetical protein